MNSSTTQHRAGSSKQAEQGESLDAGAKPVSSTICVEQETRDEIQGMLRLYTQLAKMEGFLIDKKACRYNEMTDYCIFCGLLAGFANKTIMLAYVEEAVSSCIIGDAMHVPGKPLDWKPHSWMLPQT